VEVTPELRLSPALAADIPQSRVRGLQNFYYYRSRQGNKQMDTSAYHEDLFNVDNASFRTYRTFEIKGITSMRGYSPKRWFVCLGREGVNVNGLYPTITSVGASVVLAGIGHKGWKIGGRGEISSEDTDMQECLDTTNEFRGSISVNLRLR
jgi:hypothetical protein